MTSAILLRKRTQINYKSEDIIPRKVSKNDVKDSAIQKTNLVQSNQRDKVVTQDGRVFFPCQYCSRAFVEKARRAIHLNSCQAKTYILSVGNGNDNSTDSFKEKTIQHKENPPEIGKLKSPTPSQLGFDSLKEKETKNLEKPTINGIHKITNNNNNNDIRDPKHDIAESETKVISQKVQVQKPNIVNLGNSTVNENVPKKSPVQKNLVQQKLKVFSKQTLTKNAGNKESIVYQKLLLMSPDSKSDKIVSESTNDLLKENYEFKPNASLSPVKLNSLPVTVDKQNENLQNKSKQKAVKKKQSLGNKKIEGKQKKVDAVNEFPAVSPKLPLTQSNSHDTIAVTQIKIKRKYKKRQKQIVQPEQPATKFNKVDEIINMSALNMVLDQSYLEFANSDDLKEVTESGSKKSKKRKPNEISNLKNVKKPKFSQKKLDTYNISSSLIENAANTTGAEINGHISACQVIDNPPISSSAGKNGDSVSKNSVKNVELKPTTLTSNIKKVNKKKSQLSKKPKIMIKFKTKQKINKGKKVNKRKKEEINKIGKVQPNANESLKLVIKNGISLNNNKEIKKNNIKKSKQNKISNSVIIENGANVKTVSAVVVTSVSGKAKRKYTPRKPKELKLKQNEQLGPKGDKNTLQNVIKCIDEVVTCSLLTSTPNVSKNNVSRPNITPVITKVKRKYKPRKPKEKMMNKSADKNSLPIVDEYVDEISTYQFPISAADFARSLALRPVKRIEEPKPDTLSIPDDDIFVEDETDDEAMFAPSNITTDDAKQSDGNLESVSDKKLENVEEPNIPQVLNDDKITNNKETKAKGKPKKLTPPKVPKSPRKKEVLTDSVGNESKSRKVVKKIKEKTQVEGNTKANSLGEKPANTRSRKKVDICQSSPVTDGTKSLNNDSFAEKVIKNKAEDITCGVKNSNLQKSSPPEESCLQELSSIPTDFCDPSNDISINSVKNVESDELNVLTDKVVPKDVVPLSQDAAKNTETTVAKNALISQDVSGKNLKSTSSKNIVLLDVSECNTKTFTVLQNISISQDTPDGNTKTFAVLQNVIPASQEIIENNTKTYALLQNMVPISQSVIKKSTETSTDPHITNITQTVIQKPRKEMKDASVQTVSQEVMKSVEEELEKIFNQSDDKFKEDEIEEEFDEEMDALVLEDDPSEPKAKEEFICHYCQEVFDKQLDMLRHRREAHKFPKILVSKKNLEKYYDIQDRTHCPICKKPIDKKHQYRSYFIKHLKTHVDDIKYTCPKCNTKFRRQDHMKSHMKRHIELQ